MPTSWPLTLSLLAMSLILSSIVLGTPSTDHQFFGIQLHFLAPQLIWQKYKLQIHWGLNSPLHPWLWRKQVAQNWLPLFLFTISQVINWLISWGYTQHPTVCKYKQKTLARFSNIYPYIYPLFKMFSQISNFFTLNNIVYVIYFKFLLIALYSWYIKLSYCRKFTQK